jgi:hypothetical protein
MQTADGRRFRVPDYFAAVTGALKDSLITGFPSSNDRQRYRQGHIFSGHTARGRCRGKDSNQQPHHTLGQVSGARPLPGGGG